MHTPLSPLFTYGSLMYESVCASVVGRQLAHEPARLQDWCRYALQGRTYPGAVPKRGAAIDGVLWHGLTEAEFARLDAFESVEYQRIPVTVLNRLGLPVQAEVYAWLDPALLETHDWSVSRFERDHLPRFYDTHRPR